MKRKTSIIVSSIAACALFASIFGFNSYAYESKKCQAPAASVATTLQALKAQPGTTVLNNDTAKAVNLSTTSSNKNCPKVNGTQSTNNQQTNTTNISKEDILNKLQNSNGQNSKSDYSALKSQLEALLKGCSGSKATTPAACTAAKACNGDNACPSAKECTDAKKCTDGKTCTPAKPATSTPNTSTPAKPSTDEPSKPSTSAPSNGDYSAFQKKVVDLVNAERAKAGLKPLTMNASLNKTATLKSQDMAKLNYFDHNSPTYGSPFDMMKKYGISYRTAGENIAMGQTSPEQVMNGWMNSPGHRANILNSSFTEIGVGIAKNSDGRLYWTQQFIG